MTPQITEEHRKVAEEWLKQHYGVSKVPADYIESVASLLASRESAAFERGRDFQDAKMSEIMGRDSQAAFNAGQHEGYAERRKEERLGR